MAKIVLYGGTFNPIHNGHVAVCEYILGCGYDRMIIMPAATPPHKRTDYLASGEHRTQMCSIATTHLTSVMVDSWEIDRGGKSYTVDTISHLKTKYVEDEFFLLIGSDMLMIFEQWREWQRLAEMSTLLVVMRGDEDKNIIKEKVELLTKENVRIILLNNPVVEISSTKVRSDFRKMGRSLGVPRKVEGYIMQNTLYQMRHSAQELRDVVQKLVVHDRYLHTLAVEVQARHLAEIYGADVESAAVAAVLHDVCKNMDSGDMVEMILNAPNSSDYPPEKVLREMPKLLHSWAGAVYIEKELGITDIEIINSVRYHTSARADMTLLDKIIYLADFTSAERDYPDVDVLRKLVEKSLDESMAYALEFTIKDLTKRGLIICEDTLRAYEQYVESEEQ